MDLNHQLIIFGCLVAFHMFIFIIVPGISFMIRVRCILLEVSEESKAYRLYDPISHKIIVKRDAIFEEKNGWE